MSSSPLFSGGVNKKSFASCCRFSREAVASGKGEKLWQDRRPPSPLVPPYNRAFAPFFLFSIDPYEGGGRSKTPSSSIPTLPARAGTVPFTKTSPFLPPHSQGCAQEAAACRAFSRAFQDENAALLLPLFSHRNWTPPLSTSGHGLPLIENSP